jgi:hypothetical protein
LEGCLVIARLADQVKIEKIPPDFFDGIHLLNVIKKYSDAWRAVADDVDVFNNKIDSIFLIMPSRFVICAAPSS